MAINHPVIFVMEAVAVRKLTKDDLEKAYKKIQIEHENWKEKTFEDYVRWAAEWKWAKYELNSFQCGYFLDENRAKDYAMSNMADINESGFYPYLAVVPQQVDTMYPDCSEPFGCDVFKYNRETNSYDQVTDFDADEAARYILAAHSPHTKTAIVEDPEEILKSFQ